MKSIICFLVLSFFFEIVDIPVKIEKKIDKQVLSTFELISYLKEEVLIDEEIEITLPVQFNNENFYKIITKKTLIGYFYYGKAQSKADVFDYVVIFDNELIIKKIKILAYREDIGGEIGSKRWLKQFENLSHNDQVEYGKNIRGISGATISARSMTIAVNKLLKSLAILQKSKQL